MPGPQNYVKCKQINQKKVFTQIWAYRPKKKSLPKKKKVFTQKSGTQKGQGEKKFWPKLNATTSTLPGPLSPGPPRPGPGYDVPPEPPSRRPCTQHAFVKN